jgi:hypothetical protein
MQAASLMGTQEVGASTRLSERVASTRATESAQGQHIAGGRAWMRQMVHSTDAPVGRDYSGAPMVE